MGISRREALFGTVVGGLSACATTPRSGPITALTPTSSAAFKHGVASGDPAHESVVLWTRITTDAGNLPVAVELAETDDFTTIIWTIETETGPARDHTVKVVPTGLTPGKTYYYRFTAAGETSPTGRTKTLPESASSAKFAIMSCSNYPFGYFNAYDHVARATNIDAILHLGDYLYEYGPEGYGGDDGARLGRAHEPQHEIVSLQDYRTRHAQYKADPASRAMHAAHPLIPIWDDHETTNDSWVNGAENHQPDTEGSWDERRRAALQAYYEWQPVREPEPGKSREALFRDFRWGNYLSLSAIETRLIARDKPLDYAELLPELKTPEDFDRFKREVLADPSRELLGRTQLDYLDRVLKKSKQQGDTWRLVANQVIMAKVILPDVTPYVTEEQIVEFEKQWDMARAFIEFTRLGLPFNTDAWDGYPAARERFYQMARNNDVRDLIVVTGDTHEAWANDLYTDDNTKMGVELATTSVTSPGLFGNLGEEGGFDYSLLMRRENRDVRFHDPMHRGYFTLTLDEDDARVDYVGLSTILSSTYEALNLASIDLIKRDGSVEFGRHQGLGFKERVVWGSKGAES